MVETTQSATAQPIAPWVYVGIYPWFLAWGLTLAAAAWSYAYRTRGLCTLCGQGR